MLDELLFPKVVRENWQMMPWERIALTGVLSRLKPKGAIEIGVYYGGSLSLTSQYVESVIAIDIDPEVPTRFEKQDNVDIWIGNSVDLIPKAISSLEAAQIPINFVLIDADHTAAGVKRDIELVLNYVPREPMIIMMHDSGNPETRRGILSADWAMNPYLHLVDTDFIPGQIIEHSVQNGRGEIWGGLALAYLNATPRTGLPIIQQSARTSLACLHYCAADLSVIMDEKS